MAIFPASKPTPVVAKPTSSRLPRGWKTVLSAVLSIAMTATVAAVEYNDDFANRIDPEHWTLVSNQPLYSCDESGGDLLLNKPEGGGGWARREFMKLCFSPDLLGDFDVSVDFSDALVDWNSEHWGNELALEVGIGPHYFQIARGDGEGGDWVGTWVDPPGVGAGFSEDATSGRLRIARVGAIVTAYFNDTVVHSGDYSDEQVTHLCLALKNNYASDPLSVRFDNFSLVADGYSPARQVGKIGSPDAPGAFSFGESLAISGDTLVVADRRADGVCRLREEWNDRCGAVYVFERVGDIDHWRQVTRFAPAEDAFIRFFGTSIAIDGDTIAVGHQSSSGGGVFIYQRNRGGTANWGEVAKLEAVAPYEHFGDSVALSGDTLLVGAPDYGSGYLQTEGVRVFERNLGGPDNWGEVGVITPSHGMSNDQFGSAVAISGDTAVVGSPHHNHGGCPEEYEWCSFGAVFVFERNHGGPDRWGEVAELEPEDVSRNDYFGSSVAIDGDVVVVGSGSSNTIRAHFFERKHDDPLNWTQAAEFTGGLYFPRGAEVSGDTAIFPYDHAPVVFNRGEGVESLWGETTRLSAREGRHAGVLNGDVAIGDGYCAVGAPNGDVNCPGDNPDCNSGAVYLFVVDTAPTPAVGIRRPRGRRRP